MKKKIRTALLLTLSCTLVFSGCRRKPVETEPETQKQTETESETKQTETEKETETQKATTKQTETQKATTKQTEAKTTVTPSQAQTTAPQTETQQTEAPATAQCPYCGYWYYTSTYQDGTSDYSIHVASEEAAIQASTDASSYDSSDYYTGTDGTQYAQCQYCFQWFSTAADASGYSPYSEHVAQESAYAAQMGYEAEYVQCPNCGNWVTPSEYNEHIANGW